MSVEYARVRVVTCISCNESVQRVGPSTRAYSKITPAASGSVDTPAGLCSVGSELATTVMLPVAPDDGAGAG